MEGVASGLGGNVHSSGALRETDTGGLYVSRKALGGGPEQIDP